MSVVFWSREVISLVRLAGPVVMVQLGLMLMGTVDTIMLGHLSATALAAGSLGHRQVWTAMVFPLGMLMALDPVVAQAVGAKDEANVRLGLQRGLVLSTLLSAPFAATLFLARPFLDWTEQPEDAAAGATAYSHICALGVLPFLWFATLRQVLQSLECLRPILVAIVVANLLNVGLNWLLIFGSHGAPELGVVGAAWASVGSRWAMVGMLVWGAWPQLRPRLEPILVEAWDRLALLRLARVGLPTGIQISLEMGIFSLVALLMGHFGERAIGGHEVAIQLASLSFMVPFGIGAAAAVRVGHAVGREDPDAARRAARIASLGTVVIMSGFAVTFLLVPDDLARLWTDDATVLAVAVILLPLAGLFQLADGLQAVSGGILRGLGDTRTPMLANLIGFWAIGLPASWFLAFRLGWNEAGLWWGLVVGLFAVAVGLVLRVRLALRRGGRRIVITGRLGSSSGDRA